MSVIMIGLGCTNTFKIRQCFRGSLLPEQALAVVCKGIGIVGIAFEGGTITCFGFGEFAPVKVNVTKLPVMMRFVEVMYLVFEFLYAAPVVCPGQLEASQSRSGGDPVHEKEIQNGV